MEIRFRQLNVLGLRLGKCHGHDYKILMWTVGSRQHVNCCLWYHGQVYKKPTLTVGSKQDVNKTTGSLFQQVLQDDVYVPVTKPSTGHGNYDRRKKDNVHVGRTRQLGVPSLYAQPSTLNNPYKVLQLPVMLLPPLLLRDNSFYSPQEIICEKVSEKTTNAFIFLIRTA